MLIDDRWLTAPRGLGISFSGWRRGWGLTCHSNYCNKTVLTRSNGPNYKKIVSGKADWFRPWRRPSLKHNIGKHHNIPTCILISTLITPSRSTQILNAENNLGYKGQKLWQVVSEWNTSEKHYHNHNSFCK